MARRGDNLGAEKTRSYAPEGGEVIQRNVRMVPDLYDLACEEAKRDGITLSEVFTRAFAEKIGRPELWTTPKERPGPKPGEKPHRKQKVAS